MHCRKQVFDASRHGRRVAAVLAHQWMIEKVAVENFELAPRNRARLIADHPAVSAVEVADRQRGELGADKPRQTLHTAAREIAAVDTVWPIACSVSSAARISTLLRLLDIGKLPLRKRLTFYQLVSNLSTSR